ncbi:Phosphatidylinositol-4-phosphate 5-kinase [Gracilaria domingensis]|nr:Phosphatidylinositol-4-phosphate 5-kinase [Gracilaria domingensis]
MARLEADAVPANRATLERVQSGNIDLAQKLSGSGGGMTIKKHVAKLPRIVHGHRKKVKDGVVVFKGHCNWEIVLSIQFGLKFTSELLDDATDCEPTPEDYLESLAFDFNPNEDRASIELNTFARWLHPAPYVYKLIRKRFGVEENDFLDSTCAESRVRELPTPGRSGALFYITDDEKYFMKTIQHVEEKMLISMLESYYKHVANNPRTLLTKYLAHFTVKTRRDRHIRMVVMASIFNDSLFIDKKYDLKGSTFNRFASPEQLKSENVTLKDQDLKKPIFFRPEQLDQIMKQLEKDSAYLESHHVMDYSLLIGLSNMLPEENQYFKAEFGANEENAPYYVAYQFDEQGRKSGIRVCMGIIDFLQRFRFRKRVEYGARVIQSCSCSAASVAPPHLYRDRFMSFLREKFLPDPNLDVSTLESTVILPPHTANENEATSEGQETSRNAKD